MLMHFGLHFSFFFSNLVVYTKNTALLRIKNTVEKLNALFKLEYRDTRSLLSILAEFFSPAARKEGNCSSDLVTK